MKGLLTSSISSYKETTTKKRDITVISRFHSVVLTGFLYMNQKYIKKNGKYFTSEFIKMKIYSLFLMKNFMLERRYELNDLMEPCGYRSDLTQEIQPVNYY